MNVIISIFLMIFISSAFAQDSVESFMATSSDTDDNSEKLVSLIGWHQVSDIISIGLSQTEYRYDNHGDKDEGYSLANDLSFAYSNRLLNVPDSEWPSSRNQFINVYGVDPEIATVDERNMSISALSSGALNSTFKESASKSSFLIKGDIEDVGYYMDIGATSFKGDYLTGNISFNWSGSDFASYVFDIDRNLADVGYEYSASNCAVTSKFSCNPDSVAIIRTTPSISADLSVDKYGMSAIAGMSHYSDGNDRNFLRSKWYVVASENNGISVYLKTRNFSNSDDRLSAEDVAQYIVDDQFAMRSEDYLLGSYYSPENYGQYSLGVGMRKAIRRGQLVSGYVEQGRQKAEGTWSDAASWRVQYDAKILNTNFSVQGIIGEESSEDDYKYNYLQVRLIYVFE